MASVKILGIDFFQGTAAEAVDRMGAEGGLLVVPAAPALKDMPGIAPHCWTPTWRSRIRRSWCSSGSG
jgi:hypothetical protein